jgi:DNA-binding HxlR family transcriptional regulator
MVWCIGRFNLGIELLPVLDGLHAWGERQVDFNAASR